MNEMIERVARALFVDGGGTAAEWNRTNPNSWHQIAKVAIAAIREPNDALLEAGCHAHPEDNYHSGTTLIDIIRAEWVAMVDAAIL